MEVKSHLILIVLNLDFLNNIIFNLPLNRLDKLNTNKKERK